MDDSEPMSRFERSRNLGGNRARLVERNRGLCNSVGERRPFYQLQHQRPHIVRFLETVDRGDMGMIE